MARAKDLKQKLKAADRRRKRRPAAANQGRSAVGSTSSASQPGGSLPVDVVGLVAQAILDVADRDSSITDATVVTALRCSVRLSEPSRGDAKTVLRALDVVAAQDFVPRRKFSKAAEQLIQMAVSHKASEAEPSPFLRYLSVLVR